MSSKKRASHRDSLSGRLVAFLFILSLTNTVALILGFVFFNQCVNSLKLELLEYGSSSRDQENTTSSNDIIADTKVRVLNRYQRDDASSGQTQCQCQGPQGPPGPRGEAGRKGDNGAQGPPGVSAVPGNPVVRDTFHEYLYWLYQTGQLHPELIPAFKNNRIAVPIAHLEASELDQFVIKEKMATLRNWHVMPWTTEESLIYNKATGQLKVLIPGKYYVYSQVYFSDSSLPVVGYFTCINNQARIRSLSSTTRDIGTDKRTLSAGGIFLLEKNDFISIKIPFANISLFLEKEGTFIGAMFLDRHNVPHNFSEIPNLQPKGDSAVDVPQEICKPEAIHIVNYGRNKICISIDKVPQCPVRCRKELFRNKKLDFHCVKSNKSFPLLWQMVTSKQAFDDKLATMRSDKSASVDIHDSCQPI
ncbi:uncharacterized protein LOC102800487 [Saccoglossus kowalevskii]|uniref:Ectodysplasin-A-like n=1 Tax=Saccoglossus kowalevskii TaxID=10224 RepID=A0ABM0MNZ2_SACKO|nr:PREDICTED: ectodysplasin-A-like [Saccoglossus kowalevskii]